MFSERSAFDRVQNQLSLRISELRNSGKPLLDLTVSNPTEADFPYDEPRILAALSDARALRYEPEPLGLTQAREVVSEHYASSGVRVSPDGILLTASTSEAYSFAFKLFCDAGDEVLIPAPSYPLFEHLARFEGVQVKPYPLCYDGAWHIDLDALRNARTDRTRAIVVVSPNNPTGSYLKRDELAALAELGLPIISDEVFASYPLCEDARRATSVLESADGLVLSLSGLSKLACLPQLKLGWIALGGAEALVDEARARLELLADTFLSVNTPVQVALSTLFAARATTIDALRARIKKNLNVLRVRTSQSAITPLHVEGGWYAVLRLPSTHDESTWVMTFLESDSVLVQPGWFYDFRDEPYIVVSLITPEPVFEAGLERLVSRVQ